MANGSGVGGGNTEASMLILTETVEAAGTVTDAILKSQSAKTDLKAANGLLQQQIVVEQALFAQQEARMRFELVQDLSRQQAAFGAGNIGGGRTATLLEMSTRLQVESEVSALRLQNAYSIGKARVQMAFNKQKTKKELQRIRAEAAFGVFQDTVQVVQAGSMLETPQGSTQGSVVVR